MFTFIRRTTKPAPLEVGGLYCEKSWQKSQSKCMVSASRFNALPNESVEILSEAQSVEVFPARRMH